MVLNFFVYCYLAFQVLWRMSFFLRLRVSLSDLCAALAGTVVSFLSLSSFLFLGFCLPLFFYLPLCLSIVTWPSTLHCSPLISPVLVAESTHISHSVESRPRMIDVFVFRFFCILLAGLYLHPAPCCARIDTLILAIRNPPVFLSDADSTDFHPSMYDASKCPLPTACAPLVESFVPQGPAMNTDVVVEILSGQL